MKKRILLGIIICILIVGVILLIKKPFNLHNEFIGKWQTISAVNLETGEKTNNLTDIFGSSFLQFGSYLELKEDETFFDALIPITNGSRSNTGKYTIKRNYKEKGDCYILLDYSDGYQEKLQRVFLDESKTPYLVLDNFINGYQLTLKKY